MASLRRVLPPNRQAFTLVELLVVIAIVGLLSSVAIVATSNSRDKAKLAAAQSFEASVQHAAGSEMVGEWLFDEGSGSVARDTSGNGYNGTITGATWGTGIKGSALVLASGRYVTLTPDAVLNPSKFTITGWVKSGDFTGSYNYIYSNARDCCGTYNGIDFRIANSRLLMTLWNTGAFQLWGTTTIPNDSAWVFVAATYDGSKLVTYINGKQEASANTTLGVGSPATATPIIGGMGTGPSLSLTGSIDQVRLYGTAILASEIEKKYLAEREMFLAKK